MLNRLDEQKHCGNASEVRLIGKEGNLEGSVGDPGGRAWLEKMRRGKIKGRNEGFPPLSGK